MTTTTIDQTATVLASMFTENTGTNILDSGMAYGYNYNRNQGVDFLNTPKASVKYGPTLDTFHYLNDRISFSPAMDRLFSIFSVDSEDYWMADMHAFAEHMNDSHYGSVSGSNTYNYENLLSQVIQWVEFEYKNTHYILLQIHGGCDVRGGYTAPRVFEVTYGWYAQMNDCEIFCTSCDFAVSMYGGDIVDRDGSTTDILNDVDLWASDVACPICGKDTLAADAPYPY